MEGQGREKQQKKNFILLYFKLLLNSIYHTHCICTFESLWNLYKQTKPCLTAALSARIRVVWRVARKAKLLLREDGLSTRTKYSEYTMVRSWSSFACAGFAWSRPHKWSSLLRVLLAWLQSANAQVLVRCARCLLTTTAGLPIETLDALVRAARVELSCRICGTLLLAR